MKATILAALAAAVWGAATVASAQQVVLVRHAEKADASRDPVLSDAGEQRAHALVGTFVGAGPDLVLVSPLQRTALTAAPTVAAFGVPVRAFALDDGVEAHVAAIVGEIAAQPESALVLVVGHSNTIPLIARALGVEAADMPECEYDRLMRVDLNAMAPHVDVIRYGAASTC